MRVASVDDETRDVASLVTGRRLEALPARPGQFYVWRFLTRTQWWRPHPFSLSAVPSADAMRITVQAAGAGTRRLVDDVRPGTLIAAEGPYGVFTAEACRGDGVLLVDAGVGITPLRALAESVDDRGGVILLHRLRTREEALFEDELTALAQRRARPPPAGRAAALPGQLAPRPHGGTRAVRRRRPSQARARRGPA
jgi:ferredoxin-NADP reductase